MLALADAVVPRSEDGLPASEAGALDFMAKTLAERPEWRDRVARVLTGVRAASDGRGSQFVDLSEQDQCAVLDQLAGDPDFGWLARLVTLGYYADPSNLGNRGATTWKALGWEIDSTGRLPERNSMRGSRPRHDVGDELSGIDGRYDAIVVGAGAGGGVAACALAESGRRVLVIETGTWPDTADLATDHLRNPRISFGFRAPTDMQLRGNPRSVTIDGEAITVSPEDRRWGGNAATVGGGTRVFGGHAWRLTPEDLRMASEYGTPDGSALVDWPISYDDLEPYYSRAEWEFGVAGLAEGDRFAGARSRDYPMPPLALTRSGSVLAEGARAMGISTLPPPLLINSRTYLGRPACVRCAQCVGFACPVDAKNGSQNTVLKRALSTGRCRILTAATAARVLVDDRGRAIGVVVLAERGGTVVRREVLAEEIILSAGAVETARLLLNSSHDREPDGIGNRHDQVGRHLHAHIYGGATAIFDDVVMDLAGPGPSIATGDFRHRNPGVIGGGMLTNAFTATPVAMYGYLSDAGLLPTHGRGLVEGMRTLTPRMMRVYGPVHGMTMADSRVRVDPALKDRLGIPVAHLSGGVHPEDLRVQAMLSQKSSEWLTSSGARTVVPFPQRPTNAGPTAGQHQAGTCRMGTDPRHSVTDPWGRVWGHNNVRVVDGSLNVTSGGVNPVLTIIANAMRVLDHLVHGGQ